MVPSSALWSPGFSAAELQHTGWTLPELREGGYTLAEVRPLGHPKWALTKAGYSC